MVAGVTHRRLTYRPDLDGLRAIAVGLVMLSHAGIPWTNNGGDAGVTAFFVLSGFLITSLLLDERSATGGVSIRGFYGRRVRRLGPALLVLLIVVALSLAVIPWRTNVPLGIVASLFYVSNWVQVAGISIDPLGHTWSLAIEEQFYLLWPILIVVAGRRAAWLAVAGIVAGFVVRTAAGGTFEYFSTFARGDAILAGCLLAMAGGRIPAVGAAAGVAALLTLGMANLSHDLTIPLATIATLAVLAGAWSWLGILAPMGKRAYGLYLWNWPLTILFGPWALVATVLVAEASYRLVERPVMLWRPERRVAPVTA